jgi:hypothetical protein
MGPDLFEPGPLADWMAFWAAEVARYPYEELGRAVEKIIAHRRAQIPAVAWAHLETWIEASHPHAARFFEIHRTQNR